MLGKGAGEVGLVGKSAVKRNLGKRTFALAQSAFGALNPARNNITVWSRPERTAKGAEKMANAQPGDFSQFLDRYGAIKIGIYERIEAFCLPR